jgi:hypothetical protein
MTWDMRVQMPSPFSYCMVPRAVLVIPVNNVRFQLMAKNI